MRKSLINQNKALSILAKRKALKEVPIELFDSLFPQQKAFADDPAKLKMVCCTRRAGKSMTAAIYMISEALRNPGVNCLAIGLTRASIKAIMWKDCLRVLNTKHKLNARFNLADLSMTLQNGSVIKLTGVDSEESEGLKLLGAKYRLVCIDEASMISIDLRNLVYGILKPAMTDPNSEGQRGTIAMMGTSSNFTRGLFFDIANGRESGWSVHRWTAFDNPYISKQWAEELEEIKSLRPLYMETPQFRQWYLNEWVVETDKLCYKFKHERNIYTQLPKLSPNGWTYTLGIDLGYEDDTAFVLTGYHENDPHLYVMETYNESHMSLDKVVDKINEFIADKQRTPSRFIVDGSSKQAVETMRQRSAIAFEPSDKTGKVDYIELLNADLIQGNILVHKSCAALINEMMSLVWKADGERIVIPKKEHPALPNHLCDALLYNWRMSYHHQHSPAKKALVVGSKEHYAKMAEDIWERERELLQKQSKNDGDWPEGGDWGNL